MQVILFQKKANAFWQATRDWCTNTDKQKDKNSKYLLFTHKNVNLMQANQIRAPQLTVV